MYYFRYNSKGSWDCLWVRKKKIKDVFLDTKIESVCECVCVCVDCKYTYKSAGVWPVFNKKYYCMVRVVIYWFSFSFYFPTHLLSNRIKPFSLNVIFLPPPNPLHQIEEKDMYTYSSLSLSIATLATMPHHNNFCQR